MGIIIFQGYIYSPGDILVVFFGFYWFIRNCILTSAKMPPWRWHNYRAQWSILYQQISPHHNDIISIFRQKSSINYYNTCTCLCPSQQWCHIFVQNVVLFLCFIFIWKGIFSVKKPPTTFVIVQTFFYTFNMFNENTITFLILFI